MTPEKIATIKSAKAKIAEALHEIVQACADDGEPEVLTNCFIIYETQGWRESGEKFDRQAWFLPEAYEVTRSASLGLLEMAVPSIRHGITCRDSSCPE